METQQDCLRANRCSQKMLFKSQRRTYRNRKYLQV